MTPAAPRPAEAGGILAACLPRRIEATALARPDAMAVVYGEWRLTYRDFNQLANRFARRLQDQGVVRGDLVGLCLDRGPDLLAALVATLKLGAGYVPLDPAYPAARLARMAAAAKPRVIVSRTAHAGLAAGCGAAGLDLDREAMRGANAHRSDGEAADPGLPVGPDDPCYVMFTSGSTGEPKGVPVSQGNVDNLFPALAEELGLGPGDTWTWFHSCSFGFSVWEIFGALLHGGCLVVVPEAIRADPAALGQLVADEQVTIFSQTPSAFRRLLRSEAFHRAVAGSALRCLALSGEAVRGDDLAAWFARYPARGPRLVNTYAITETAGQLTLRTYAPGEADDSGARIIGRPLPGREFLVRDGDGAEVPPGEPGELWVGGPCVVAGYLDDPLRTATRFQMVELPGRAPLRCYRTGDRVRVLPDGRYEYLGRADALIKLRGFRIQPEEVEAALREHPSVRDAAVAVRPDAAGNPRLVGYVVGTAPDPDRAPAPGLPEFWPSLGAHGIYDGFLYDLMNVEPARLAAYRAAFARAVPGRVVLDIGTGQDAVLARLCLEAGARHVYAVEVLPEAARRARDLVASLGLADRITVIEGDIASVNLPEPVDVCTQGIIGNIGSADGIVPVWNAARRLFAPELVPVPARCETRIAALELPAAVRDEPRFAAGARPYVRRLFEAAGQPHDVRLCIRNVSREHLISSEACFELLDFTAPLEPEHGGQATLAVTRDGCVDGLLLWTVVTAADGHAVDYLDEQQAWLPVYFPLDDGGGVAVRRGDVLELEWRCSHESDPRFPDYAVKGRVRRAWRASRKLGYGTRHAETARGATETHRRLLADLERVPEPLSVNGLRDWLAPRLPEHLVPQSWCFLPELPLGPAGKLDRDALPAPGRERPRLARPPVPPRTALEQILAGLWEEALAMTGLGVEDDFFDLGGDSVTAVQLTTATQRAFDAGIPLVALFEAPTIAGVAAWLLAHHGVAVSRRTATGSVPDKAPDANNAAPAPAVATAPASPPAAEAVDGGAVPLSFPQQSLWFLHQLHPCDTSASEQFALVLEGPLDRAALDRAWQGLLARHPVLRTTFTGDEGEVRAIIGAVGSASIPVVEVASDDALAALATAELAQPFDLPAGPLLRPVLARFGSGSDRAGRHVLLVTAEHLVADGLSVPVIRADLAALYGAAVAGTADPLPPPGPGYAAFARDQAGRQIPAPDLDWWRTTLADLPGPLLEELPRPAGVPPGAESRRRPFSLDVALADAVRRLARDTGTTPFMVLLAAFRTVLARWTGRDDLVIGTPMTLRDDTTRHDVGCYVNPVALRTPVAADASFTDLLARERATVLGALDHRHVPFHRVVAEVAPERRLGEHPIFQVLFSLDAAPGPTVTAAGVQFQVDALAVPRASFFDLECGLKDPGEGSAITGHLAWASSRLEDRLATALADAFTALLADALARPVAPVGRLALLPADGRARLAPAPDVCVDAVTGTLHGLVVDQACRTPGAIAVVAVDGELSYGQLDRRSRALAARLRVRGVVPGEPVGLALGRTRDLVVALLAVLRAGAVALPLDPGYPAERRRFILADAGARFVLTAAGASGEAGEGVEYLYVGAAEPLDEDPGSDARRGASVESPPDPAVGPDDPALLLYTSGSTGQPKGAIVRHRGSVHRCRWMWDELGLGTDEIFAARTSPNFIDAFWEIFGPLARGARVQVVPDDLAGDPLALPGHLARHGATHLVLVPSLLRAMLDSGPGAAAGLAGLRHCIVSGEPLDPALARRFRAALPGCRLLNTYGTTEIWDATWYDVAELPADAVRVPIGRPLPGVRVLVLDGLGEPLPPGVPGELCVAGPGVGPGYWRRPELTAARFVPDAFAGTGLLYRTGDRGRELADGHFECLGRLDAQLKVRGYRIEAAEVEGALAAHPAVAEAAVALRPGPGGSEVLVAYVVLKEVGEADAASPGEPVSSTLRAFLAARLPAPSVPAAFVVLPSLPRTASGKLDRRALPAPGHGYGLDGPGRSPAGDVAPRTRTEQRLAALWAELLGGNPPGRADDFFEVGGHSLLAARLVTRARASFGVALGLKDVFEAPTLAAFAARIDARRPDGPGPVPGPRGATLPLSFAEERLWFLDQLDPGSAAWNVAWTVAIDGPLDADRLKQSLGFLVARHEPLRTTYPSVDGRPTRHIAPAPAFGFEVIEGAGADDAALEDLLRRAARRPFDLARGPLLRATLVRRDVHHHDLLLVIHHIATDATSNHLLYGELVAVYEALTDGRAIGLPPLPLQYADYAAWQRRKLHGPAAEAELDGWRARLAGAPPALELPADRPRPPEQSFRGAWLGVPVPPALAADLRELARSRGCTLYHVLLAAFDVFLARIAGATDVLVGSPVEGRLELAFENLVGLFINTLVLRVDLADEPSFADLLARVRAVAVDAQAHQELPFERLVEALRPERSLARAPVFQVLFNLVRLPTSRQGGGGCDWRLHCLVDTGVAAFDLALTAGERDDQLELTFEYATDLFDAATVERWARCFTTLLGAVVATPMASIADLPLLTAAEQAEALARGNLPAPTDAIPAGAEPTAALAAFVPVSDQVLAQARTGPDAVALEDGSGPVSYAELRARSLQLAGLLAVRGIGPGDRVGIGLPRSAEYLIAVLAVLWRGAAYVPLDPDYPAARLAEMAADAKTGLVITRAGAVQVPGPVLDLADADAAAAASAPAVAPVPVGADDLAYVIFTSGSTGRPRGVAVTHGNLAAVLAGWQSVYGPAPGETHLQMAAAAFDVFTGDWVRALATGGRLVICPRETLLDPPALAALIDREQVRIAEFVPAVVRPLVAHLERVDQRLTGLRLAIVGSDTWHGHEYRALRARCCPSTRVVNSYGVAEATIDSSWFETGDDLGDDLGPGTVPIGRPFPHARLYVLDGRGVPVPDGVPGELWIGGPGVARGYEGEPGLTAARFAPDPASPVPGARRYRTGDRVRRRRDGNLEFLGRVDFQIKLRGQRIEPGEIEAVLSTHPAVAAAVVAIHESPDANAGQAGPRLVAWVARRGETPPAAPELRAFLAARLPAHLVPAAFVILDELPRTPNGKLDRRHLPAPDWAAAAAGAAPATPVEAGLAAIFAGLLGVPAVGTDLDFFAAGGHSLLATRLVAKVRTDLGRELPLRAVFESPTVAALARVLEGSAAATAPIPRRGPGTAVPLSPAQRRLWFLDQLQPGNPAWHLHLAWRLQGTPDVPALEAALAELAARHEVLRARIVTGAGDGEGDGQGDGEPRQVFADPGPGVGGPGFLAVAPAPVDDVAAWVRAELARPFDLTRGPMLRASLAPCAGGGHVLLLVLHHIAGDGWSLTVLARELAALYAAARGGREPALPALPVGYGDYALWQAEELAGGGRERELAYWRGALAGAPEILELPADFPRPPVPSDRGAWLTRTLPADLHARLRDLARAQGCTLFMLLLAAFGVLLARRTGRDDLLVGTPVAGRRRAELEGLVGFFVNTLPLRVTLAGNPDWTTLLRRVRGTTLAAWEHQDVPFEALVEALNPRRDRARTPLVQVFFALHNQPRESVAFAGLDAEPLVVEGEAVKFDLALHAAEEGAGLVLAWAWRTDLYAGESIALLADEYAALLADLAAGPPSATAGAPVLPDPAKVPALVRRPRRPAP